MGLKTKIKYNGTTVATMDGNVAVTYGGTTEATISSAGTKTLNVQGCLMQNNIVLKNAYAITSTITNMTVQGSSTYSGTLLEGGSLTLTVGADGSSYKLPDEVSGGLPTGWSCTGATMTYSKTNDTSGSITLSNPSSSTYNISFTVVGEEVSTSETWVINSEADVSTVDFSIGFTSNSTSYSAMTINILGSTGVGLYYDSTLAASGRAPSVSTWINESYRTVTFSTAPTGDLLTWLQANAVKQ